MLLSVILFERDVIYESPVNVRVELLSNVIFKDLAVFSLFIVPSFTKTAAFVP